MKIQCNACQRAEANVLCCADGAALCWACDQKVHAANKLAGKHQRVPLSSSSSSPMPKCDICQVYVLLPYPRTRLGTGFHFSYRPGVCCVTELVLKVVDFVLFDIKRLCSLVGINQDRLDLRTLMEW